MNKIGYIIKTIREQRKITQEELAFELNISQSKLSKIENGKTEPTIYFLISIFNFFSFNIYELAEFIQNIQ
ncbi:MAG: helix-turn-helix transcriptional regulator [Bergeyella sp.]